ncbi:MAG: glycoside hydrolase family 28 protein [Arcticibacter sp.]
MKSHLLFLVSLAFGLGTQAQTTTSYSWDNLPQVARPVFKADTINILKYGAVADGQFLNTRAINQAIEDCSKKGGGVVLIPAGLWVSGPVYLRNNVNLHLAKSATLFFTADKSQYKIIEGEYEGRKVARNESPINGKDLENIAITGKGIIDGNGDVWRAVHQRQLPPPDWQKKVASGGVVSDDGKTWYPSQQFKDATVAKKSMLLMPGKPLSAFEDMKDVLRPNLLVLNNCKKVLIEGVILQNSAAWCLHPILCEDLTISDVMVKNPDYAHNGDGMDIESCRNFIIENSILDVGDDAICIKSGKDEEGRKRGRPSENGIIRGNTVYKGHGGVVVGSEMSGGARNLFIENCSFLGTDKGLRFKSTRGRGGVVENIYARNLFMKDIVQEAVFFDMHYFVKFITDSERDTRPVVNEGTPVFRNMVFENIACSGASHALFIRGLSEMPIQNITLKNSVLKAETGIELVEVSNIRVENVQLKTKADKPLVLLNTAKNVTIDGLKYGGDVNVLVKLDGKDNQKISIRNTDTKKVKQPFELSDGATKNQIVIK